MKTLTILLACLLLASCSFRPETMNFKFVTSGQDSDNARVISQVLHGNSLKPLAPVNLRGSRNAAGDLLIEWTRRSRLAPGLRPDTGVPVAEEQEWYDVEIYSGSTLKRGPIRLRTLQSETPPTVRLTEPNRQWDYTLQRLPFPSGFAQSPVLLAIDAGFEQGAGIVDFNGTRQDVSDIGVARVSLGWNVFAEFSSGGGNLDFSVYENNVQVYTEAMDIGEAGKIYNLRVEVRNGRIVYFKNYQNAGSVPDYQSTIDATQFESRDMRGLYLNEAVGSAMSARPDAYVYTADQQTADFGSVQSSIKVRVYQVSSVVGRGFYVEGNL